MKFYSTLSVIILGLQLLSAQTDHISWTGMEFKLPMDRGIALSLKPIVRHNMDLKSYSNSSIDMKLTKSIPNNFSLSYTYRHWWLKDGINRVFWWFDIAHDFKISSKLSLKNRMRWHIAMNLQLDDPNFIRYLPALQYTMSDDLKAYIGVELWHDLETELDRKRYQIGFDKSFGNNWGINFQYWHERTENLELVQTNHTFVTTLRYVIPPPAKK